jgi:hypothetical protein
MTSLFLHTIQYPSEIRQHIHTYSNITHGNAPHTHNPATPTTKQTPNIKTPLPKKDLLAPTQQSRPFAKRKAGTLLPVWFKRRSVYASTAPDWTCRKYTLVGHAKRLARQQGLREHIGYALSKHLKDANFERCVLGDRRRGFWLGAVRP